MMCLLMCACQDNILNLKKVNDFSFEKEIFIKEITNQTILDIKRRGKFLMFELDEYYLISHLLFFLQLYLLFL